MREFFADRGIEVSTVSLVFHTRLIPLKSNVAMRGLVE